MSEMQNMEVGMLRMSILLVFVVITIAVLSLDGVAQSPSTLQRERQINSIPENDLQRRMMDMRGLEPYAKRRSEKDRREAEALNPPEHPKELKDRIRKMRTVDGRDIARFRNLLEQPKTGIFRIFPSMNCTNNRVVNVSGECEAFVPDSNDFAFRTVEYSNRLFHDIGFEGNQLISGSFYSQGMFVNLGRMPLDSVSLDTPGVKQLWDMKVADTHAAAIVQAKQLEDTISVGGFTFSSSIEPIAEHAIVLRAVAYRSGKTIGVIRPDTTMNEIKFKSLENDPREDILIAFRIIRVAVDGGLTIVWKELGRREAPKLKFGKNDKLEDFK